jgi:phosphate transport system permease protein
MAGAGAIGLALGALVLLLGAIGVRGLPAFWQYEVTLPLDLSAEALDLPDGWDERDLGRADFAAPVRNALREIFPEVRSRGDRRRLSAVVSSGASFDVRERVLDDPSLVGQRVEMDLPLSDDPDLYFKGEIDPTVDESARRLSDVEITWLDQLDEEGRVERVFNTRFFRSGDSREPELAGIWGALVGTLWTLAVTLLLCFPLGVAAAIYLEEFAHRSRWTDIIEVNINNLAAVPSIVFGLLGLAVFLNFFGLPRSAPVVGGLVLALMTLPTVIIAARSALMAVPPSIREAALGMGASPLQVVLHHVLPLAMPGILTGTIIGMARALGETAPLLMIGMVAFIVDVPSGPTSPATVLPVQIYLWADSPERAFVEKTSAAILVLLTFLVAMNLTAVILRNRTERRW